MAAILELSEFRSAELKLARRVFVRNAAWLSASAALVSSRAGIALSDGRAAESAPPCRKEKVHGGALIEPIIEPDMPIIDPHHHLWVLPDSFFTSPDLEFMRSYAHYLLEDLLADVMTGHNVRATVYMEADPMRPMYRRTGPEEMKPVGEVEFANGVAAMAASGVFGDVQACAAIVGHVELERGEAAVEKILAAHLEAGGSHYRGMRQPTVSSSVPHLLLDRRFRSGFGCLRGMGLSFDALVLAKELPELTDLARAFPETQIILNHLGNPDPKEFSPWRSAIRTLSGCSNVAVKLGGAGMMGFAPPEATPPYKSDQLVPIWKPYIETCIEAFGAGRCMFEGNFPMDSETCSYRALWNTFKRLAMGASEDERDSLFHTTAARVYRITI
jgi:L-fuconolactonase